MVEQRHQRGTRRVTRTPIARRILVDLGQMIRVAKTPEEKAVLQLARESLKTAEGLRDRKWPTRT